MREIEVRHDGLNRHRLIRGQDQWVVEQKAAELRARWNDAWMRRQDLEHRLNLPFSGGAGGKGAPVVLIIGDHGLEVFEQLSCTLRRRGMRVVLVSPGPEPRKTPAGRLKGWLRARWIYDAHIDASELGADGSLPERLDRVTILDVLADENALAAAGLKHSPLSALAARGLAHRRLPPERLLDKFEVNAILQQAGVRVPPQVRATAVSPAQAAQQLGLPLVVKARTGSGGAGVRIAASIGEIQRATEELSGDDPEGVFYQKHIEGRMVMYGVVAGPDGPVIEHGLGVEATRSPLGPSAVVRVCDDPELLAAGRSVAQAIGCLGLAELGFIRDAQGELWHVDANCRCWGNMTSLLRVGIDYPQAYLALLLDRPSRPRAAPAVTANGEAAVLPFMLFQAASQGPAREIAAFAGQLVTFCRKGPGAFYAILAFTKAGKLLGRRGLHAARRALVSPGWRPPSASVPP